MLAGAKSERINQDSTFISILTCLYRKISRFAKLVAQSKSKFAHLNNPPANMGRSLCNLRVVCPQMEERNEFWIAIT